MVHRIGNFLIFLGVVLIALYILSDIADAPSCNMLVVGVVSVGLGLLLWFRDPAPQGPPAERFRLFRSSGNKKNNRRN